MGASYMFGYDRLHWAYDAKGLHDDALAAPKAAELARAHGDRLSALTWLESGYDGRDGDMVLLKQWPVWSSLRSEPRYRSLVDPMAFSERIL